MAASNNNLWRREQISQGRTGVLARALEHFGRRGRGRGLGPPPLSVNCLGGPTTWEGALSEMDENKSGGPQTRCKGQSQTSTVLVL